MDFEELWELDIVLISHTIAVGFNRRVKEVA